MKNKKEEKKTNFNYSEEFITSIPNPTEQELKNILIIFREKQSKYPLGVCLSKEIHMLFHNNYGYGYNTPEQWEDFVSNYKNGKYINNLKVA